jgi:ribosomal protein S18 acetylase RimI-like enzyme
VSTAFEIEPMTTLDHAAVIDLWNACEGVRANETPDELARILERNPGLCLVARNTVARSGSEPQQRLAAAILCCHDGRRGYLYHLGVHPDFRRQGLATQLVDRCLAELARLGIRRCTIFLIRGNAEGEAFWRKSGWRERVDLVAFAKDLES